MKCSYHHVVARGEGDRSNAMPVHVRTIRRLQVANRHAFARAPYLGVTTRDIGVVDDYSYVWAPTNNEGLFSDRERASVAGDEARLAFAAHKLSLNREVT